MFIFFLLSQTWHFTFRIYRNRCFLVALCRLRVKRANLEVATSYFQCCGYFRCPWVSFVTTDDFSVMLTKITSRIGVSWTRSLPFWFWPILILKWAYDQKKVNQITSNHTTLWNLASPILEVFCRISLDVIFPWTKPTGILALYETNLDYSIDSGHFCVCGYLLLIQKDSVTYILTVYAKEGLPFAWYLSLENSVDPYFYFWLALLHCLTFFPLSITFFVNLT